MAESEALPGASGIRASTEKLIGQVSEKGRIRVKTDKWEKPGDWQDKVESVRVPKNRPIGHGKRVESA